MEGQNGAGGNVEALFERAADAVSSPEMKKANLSDTQKLRFYGLFQQARNGDCDKLQPSVLDIRGRAKWNAWAQCAGLSRDEAMRRYVDMVVEAADGVAPDLAAGLRRGLDGLANGSHVEPPAASPVPSPERPPAVVATPAQAGCESDAAGPVWSSTPRRGPEARREPGTAERSGNGVGIAGTGPLRRADVMDVIRSLQSELDATTNRVRELEFRTRAASPPPGGAAAGGGGGALGLTTAQLALVLLWPVAVQAAWEFARSRSRGPAGRR